MNAAAWFAGQSFHAELPASAPAPTPAVYVDTRPRADYLLPSGELVTLIRDHGEVPAPARTYSTGGEIVTATLALVSKREICDLLAHAVSVGSISLRYLAEDALDLPRSGRSMPLTPEERHEAIRRCATAIADIRLMGVKIGGGVVKVTAETITDEQIRELWERAAQGITGRICMTALGEKVGGRIPTADEIGMARERCAAAWNARHGGVR